MNTPRLKERLVVLIILAALLISPPLLLIAERSLTWPGSLIVYLFVAWGGVIGLMAWLMEHRHRE